MTRRRPLRAALSTGAAVAVAAAVAGCSPASSAAWPRWVPSVGPSAPGAVEIRDLAASPDGWVAVGAVTAGGDERAPAVWRTAPSKPGAAAWTSVPVQPGSYYGERSLLHFAALSPAGALVAVGWAAGGAHGNPRTATWSLVDAALHEQPADFELFGGPRAIDVVGIAYAGNEWTIIGNRTDATGKAGGGRWRSSDGVTFALVDEPALASGPGETVRVNGLATLAGGGLVAVGERERPGSAAKPAAWSSPDGQRWQRDDVTDIVPDDPTLARSLSRVVATPAGAVAVGVDDAGARQTYRSAVRDSTGTWHLGGSFAPTTNDELARVGALGATGRRAVALVRARGSFELWWSDGGTHWNAGRLAAAVPAGNDTSVVLAGTNDELRLVVNRPDGAQWWLATP